MLQGSNVLFVCFGQGNNSDRNLLTVSMMKKAVLFLFQPKIMTTFCGLLH